MAKDPTAGAGQTTTQDADGYRAAAIDPGGKQWFGQPRGLATLFFTEMWERFSYYGMRALLILYMTATVADGGLAFDVAKAGAIYALYTSLVYLVNVPGGWVADRILGQRRSVLWGGVVIASGHFAMAVPTLASFYLGLGLIIFGTGMLKPNISVMVGQLYASDDARRDSGFSIFYMGINLGAFIAPLITGALGEKINWHLGFGAAGVGMTLGLVQYLAGGKYLGTAGLHPVQESAEAAARDLRRLRNVAGAVISLIVLVFALSLSGAIAITAESISNSYGWLLAATTVGVFGWLFTRDYWNTEERKRLVTVMVLFLAAAVFWSAFEQAGSSLNLFADEHTNRSVTALLLGPANAVLGIFGKTLPPDWQFPASWFQALNPLFIITLAPVFAWLWIWLDRKHREPSTPGKFSVGLFFVGLGFLVMVGASALAVGGHTVGPAWLFFTYLLHTIGELFLSPVGLSAMTKLAPNRVSSLVMGIWFLAASVGNYMAGFLVRFYTSMSLPTLFGVVASFTIAAGLVMTVLVGPIKRMLARAD